MTVFDIQEYVNRDIFSTENSYYNLTNTIEDLEGKLSVENNTLNLIERTAIALKDAMPYITKNSIEECMNLANKAIQQVFGLDYKVVWDTESQRILLNKGEYLTDLVEGEGGGVSTLISFVFNLFILNKMGGRKFLAYDEAFTQISAVYFPQFISFVRDVCEALDVDIMLISHDQRITLDDVDNAYKIEKGHCVKIK